MLPLRSTARCINRAAQMRQLQTAGRYSIRHTGSRGQGGRVGGGRKGGEGERRPPPRVLLALALAVTLTLALALAATAFALALTSAATSPGAGSTVNLLADVRLVHVVDDLVGYPEVLDSVAADVDLR